MGLLYTFLLLNSRRLVLPFGLFSLCSSFLGQFYSFGHPRPILILHSHGFLLSLLGFPNPNYHILFFWDLLAFPPTPFTSSFLWAPSAHFCLLSIPHNAHGFTTFFFGLPWAHLLPLGPFYYFIGLSFGLNGFLLTLLILLLYSFPYCWASSHYWASLPKWALTVPHSNINHAYKGVIYGVLNVVNVLLRSTLTKRPNNMEENKKEELTK